MSDRASSERFLVLAPTGESVFGTPLGPEVRRPQLVRWEESDPRLRFGSTQADGEGTAVVRLGSRPAGWGEAYVQLLWRDPFSGQHGSSSVARLPG